MKSHYRTRSKKPLSRYEGIRSLEIALTCDDPQSLDDDPGHRLVEDTIVIFVPEYGISVSKCFSQTLVVALAYSALTLLWVGASQSSISWQHTIKCNQYCPLTYWRTRQRLHYCYVNQLQ